MSAAYQYSSSIYSNDNAKLAELSTSKEIEFIEERNHQPTDIKILTDDWTAYSRRVLIAVNTYGRHDLRRAAAYLNVSTAKLQEDIQKPEIANALQTNQIPCWTKAEIISKMCIEAETARGAGDRITALNKLMEFRSLAQPEGGARSFARIVSKFKV